MSDQVEEELESLRRAAESGDAWSQSELGHRYFDGRDGVVRDRSKAKYWLRKAADQGRAEAQFKLGFLILQDETENRDLKAAESWFRLAAEQGEPGGMWGLGQIHDIRGEQAESLLWHRHAAMLGDRSSQLSLALAHELGQGVPRDNVEARAWYRLSATKFPSTLPEELNTAKERGERLGTLLSPEDMARSFGRTLALRQKISGATGAQTENGDNSLPADAEAIAFRTDHFEDAPSETLLVLTTKLKLDPADPDFDDARVGSLHEWAWALVQRTPGARSYEIVEVNDDS